MHGRSAMAVRTGRAKFLCSWQLTMAPRTTRRGRRVRTPEPYSPEESVLDDYDESASDLSDDDSDSADSRSSDEGSAGSLRDFVASDSEDVSYQPTDSDSEDEADSDSEDDADSGNDNDVENSRCSFSSLETGEISEIDDIRRQVHKQLCKNGTCRPAKRHRLV